MSAASPPPAFTTAGVQTPSVKGPVLLSILATLLLLGLVFATAVPLGLPADWAWPRVRTVAVPVFEAVAVALLFATGIWVAWRADAAVRDRRQRRAWLCALVIIGTAIDLYVLMAGRLGLAEGVCAVLDEWSTGYMTRADQVDSAATFLREFPRELAADACPSHHLDVHPPGGVLLSYAALLAVRHVPAVPGLLRAILPVDIQDGLTVVRREHLFPGYRDLERAYWAAVLVLVAFLGALALARVLLVWAVASWPGQTPSLGLYLLSLSALPGPILFLGHYDPFYFALGCGTVLLLCRALLSPQPLPWATGLGVGCALSLWFSAGFLIFIPLAGGVLALRDHCLRRRYLPTLAAALAGLGALGICEAAGLHITESLLLCLRNNQRFFVKAERSTWWSVVNLADYAATLGFLPCAVALQVWRRTDWRTSAWWADPEMALWVGYALFFGVLTVSPFARGEMARLFLLYIPTHLVLFGRWLQRSEARRRVMFGLVAAAIGVSLLGVLALRAGVACLWMQGGASG